jgi:hypothetical protein
MPGGPSEFLRGAGPQREVRLGRPQRYGHPTSKNHPALPFDQRLNGHLDRFATEAGGSTLSALSAS